MNFKTVLLAAAALGVAGTAQAADLAKKAPAAANYVKICDAYGAGFFYIPGSDTCLKIGGYVRADLYAFDTSREWATIGNSGTAATPARGKHAINTLARANLQFDTRTATEYGLLRTYVEFQLSNWSANGGTSTAGMTTELKKAFVQFGGLTAGRATSFFDFWTGDTFGMWFEPSHSDADINLVGYTFTFGNGISASLSIEDPSTGNTGRRTATALVASSTYAGVKFPDLVANVNISQAWGSAQLMAALHQNYSSLVAGGADSDKWGWAIGGGVKVNLPMLGASDTFTLQAAYAKGAVAYVSPNWLTDGQAAAAFDFYVPAGTTTIEQTGAWSIAGALTHGWTKTLTSSLEASYAAHDVAKSAVGDFNQIDVQANLVWSPVDNLQIGPEIEYRRIDYSSATNVTGVRDVNAIVGMMRIQRNF